MIAKIVESKTQSSSFSRSARYILDVRGGIDPSTWERTADYVLDTSNSHEGEKVGSVFVSNCLSQDPADAVLEITATQAQNTRSKTSKHMHIVASFPPGETLSDAQLQKVETELVQSLGLLDHQRVTAVHLDTDHQHMHILINTVHPKNFRNITPYQSKQRLMDTCIKLEQEHSLQRTNHGEKANSRSPGGDIEAHSGQLSLAGWISKEGGSELITTLEKAPTWQDLHKSLAEYGLEIRPRGAGLVVGVKGDSRLHVKASSLSRSLSANALGLRLGDFEVPSQSVSQLKPRVKFQRQPIGAEKKPPLFIAFTNARKQWAKENKQVRSNASKDYARIRDDTRAVYSKKRAIVTANRGLTYLARRTKYHELDAEYRAEMHAVAVGIKTGKQSSLTPMLTWKDYLQQQARTGNHEALEELRKLNKPLRALTNSLSIKAAPEDSKTFIFSDTKTVSKSGTVRYWLKDGGVIADKASSIEVLKPSDTASGYSLTIAEMRFAGEKLKVKGSKTFKDGLVAVAGVTKKRVKFLDSGLEKKRALLSGKAKAKTRQIKPRGLGR